VEGRSLHCYLDGSLISDVTLPRPDTVLAIAGADTQSGDVILKILNTTGENVQANLRLDGATHVAPEGELTVLTSGNPEDENSFATPDKIAPIARAIPTGRTSAIPLAPYSLNILRLHTKEDTR
jgi:alpha-L-arabinofuranosidase